MHYSIIRRTLRFRRFSHKAYAVFMSMHREVSIGRVCRAICDKELAKAGKVALIGGLLGMTMPMFADDADALDAAALTDPSQLSLQEVMVVAQQASIQSESYRLLSHITGQQIADLPVQTIADVLQYLPGIDIRTRGANGSQADVAMRGGTFDQVLVMINGVVINDPQTGHYALNLPISALLIERIEVLEGTAVDHFGIGALTGAINIVTKKSERTEKTSIGFSLSAGSYGLLHPAFSGRFAVNDWQINTSVEYVGNDGYEARNPSAKEKIALNNTDLRSGNAYLQATDNHWDIQAGVQYKDAGAGMFYGFGSQDQFDATRTAFGAVKYNYRKGKWSINAQAAYRANYDRYEWHRGKRLYGNFHFNQTAATALRAHYASMIGTTSFGVEARNENIHSTNLGDTINKDGQVPNVDGFASKDVRVLNLVKGTNRTNVNAFAQQTFHYDRFSASVGVGANYNTKFGWGYLTAINFGYEYQPNSSVYANIDRSMRLPSFTDLYYNAGNQLGNRNLRPESAWTFSVGVSYNKNFGDAGSIELNADAYYRLGRNIIDWIYVPEDTKRPYHAMNQQKVNTAGTEMNMSYRYNDWLRAIGVRYAYTWQDLDLKETGSRYLDYLSHKLVLNLNHGIYVFRGKKGTLGCDWTLGFRKREGQYNNIDGQVADYAPIWLIDGAVYWQNPNVMVRVECTNMTNRRYYDYGGVLQPGAWPKVTIRTTL